MQILNNICNFEAKEPETEETILGAAMDWRMIEGKGRGVFARRLIKQGEVIERAPVVPMSKENVPDDGGAPDGYVLEWRDDDPEEAHALVLGYVMLYNHGKEPNIHLESDFDNEQIIVTAMRDIEPGEELSWNYNCELWFDPE